MRKGLLPVALCLGAAVANTACSGGDRSFVDNAHMSAPEPAGTVSSAGVCDVPQEGCPCDQPSATAVCKGPLIHEGSYALCPTGYRSCTDGGWGPCILPQIQ